MIVNYDQILKLEPYSLEQYKKFFFYFNLQKKIAKHHISNCKEYRQIYETLFENIKKVKTIEKLPYVHANIFKQYDLRSISKKNNYLTMFSSGTSNNNKSKINLDFKSSILQAKVLQKIIFNFISNKTNKIAIIDSEKNYNSKYHFSAKTAAIRGFAQFFKTKFFLLNDDYTINIKKINIIKKLDNILYFGFTSVVWENFLKYFQNQNICNHKNSFFIHGGGWKNLLKRKISKNLLNHNISKILGINRVYNYYGMVEQTGSIFMECEYNYYHSSIFSDIIIRDENLEVQKKNKIGLIQTMSILPTSYPGHNILTEDLGKIIAEDGCKCGRKGKFFTVIGRVKNTELRGCSNV